MGTLTNCFGTPRHAQDAAKDVCEHNG